MEDNSLSCFALSIFHRLKLFICLHAQRPIEGRWAPTLHSYKDCNTLHLSTCTLLSLFWCCWLSIRKSNRIRVVQCWHGYLSGGRCRLFFCGPLPSQSRIITCPVIIQNRFTVNSLKVLWGWLFNYSNTAKMPTFWWHFNLWCETFIRADLWFLQ